MCKQKFIILLLLVSFCTKGLFAFDSDNIEVKTYPLASSFPSKDWEGYSLPSSLLPSKPEDIYVYFTDEDYIKALKSKKYQDIYIDYIQIEVSVPYPGLGNSNLFIYRLKKEANINNCNIIHSVKIFTYKNTDNVASASCVAGLYFNYADILFGRTSENTKELETTDLFQKIKDKKTSLGRKLSRDEYNTMLLEYEKVAPENFTVYKNLSDMIFHDIISFKTLYSQLPSPQNSLELLVEFNKNNSHAQKTKKTSSIKKK